MFFFSFMKKHNNSILNLRPDHGFVFGCTSLCFQKREFSKLTSHFNTILSKLISIKTIYLVVAYLLDYLTLYSTTSLKAGKRECAPGWAASPRLRAGPLGTGRPPSQPFCSLNLKQIRPRQSFSLYTHCTFQSHFETDMQGRSELLLTNFICCSLWCY